MAYVFRRPWRPRPPLARRRLITRYAILFRRPRVPRRQVSRVQWRPVRRSRINFAPLQVIYRRLRRIRRASATRSIWARLRKFIVGLRPLVADPRFVSLLRVRKLGTALSLRRFCSTLGLSMPQGPDFGQMDIGETVTGGIDFNLWLPVGTAIASVVSIVVANYLPGGGNPYIALVGLPQIGTISGSLGGSGVTNAGVLCQWQGLQPGVARVTITIMTSDSQVLIGWAHQQVGRPN